MRTIIAFLLAVFLSTACSSSSGQGDGGTGWDDQIVGDGDGGSSTGDPSSGDRTGGDPAGGDQMIGPGDLPICGTFEVQAGAIPPNLLLVVDKSGSMKDPTQFGGTRTKLQDAKDALNMMLNNGEGRIRFGWMQFPSDSECGPGRVSIPCGDDTVPQIRNMVNLLTANGGTPTGESLENANAYQGLHDEERNNFVVLLTDGMPTCPVGAGREVTQQDMDRALQAVKALHAAGIDTFVIGLGEDLNNTNPELLNQMAIAGGRPRAGVDKYYKANSLADLQQALQDISGTVIGCNLRLNEYPEYPDWLWVFFCDANKQNCVAQKRDRTHVNGWDYDYNTNQINFYGPLCDQLRSGQVPAVQVLMGCSPPT